jgi:hypothetical protein
MIEERIRIFKELLSPLNSMLLFEKHMAPKQFRTGLLIEKNYFYFQA